MAKTQPDTFHKIIISQEETIAQQKFLIEKYAEALAVKEFLNSDYKKENEQLRKALIFHKRTAGRSSRQNTNPKLGR